MGIYALEARRTKGDSMRLTENRIRQAFNKYFDECDGDEFARLAGEIFGGSCFPALVEGDASEVLKVELDYDFQPNDFYAGEFMDIDPSIKPNWD
jgi:hypothetical protein